MTGRTPEQKPTGVEWKPTCSSESLNMLRGSVRNSREQRCEGRAVSQTLRATDHDTPDHRLFMRQFALRVGKQGRRFVQTVQSSGPLFDTALERRGKTPPRIETHSKAQRGYALAGLDPAAPNKGAKPRLSLDGAFESIFRSFWVG